MKINKKTAIPALALVGLTLGTTVVNAAEATQTLREKPAHHASSEFQSLLDSLSEEQKEILKKAHELKREGKTEEAAKLIESSDLPLPEFLKHIRHNERKRELDVMIEGNDYEAFQQKVANTPMADVINTQEKFEALVESHTLLEEGKKDEAKQILEDAGISPFGRVAHAR